MEANIAEDVENLLELDVQDIGEIVLPKVETEKEAAVRMASDLADLPELGSDEDDPAPSGHAAMGPDDYSDMEGLDTERLDTERVFLDEDEDRRFIPSEGVDVGGDAERQEGTGEAHAERHDVGESFGREEEQAALAAVRPCDDEAHMATPSDDETSADESIDIEKLVANAKRHVKGPDHNGYIQCPVPPFNENKNLGRITSWMRGKSCRCYAHDGCSLARPAAAFTNDQYIDWLLRGVLADVLSDDGLAETSWSKLTPVQKRARKDRHMRMAEEVP